MVDNDLIRHNEEKYVALAEGIIGVLKSYKGLMTAREIARELFTDPTLVMMALNDEELGLPVLKLLGKGKVSGGDFLYMFNVK